MHNITTLWANKISEYIEENKLKFLLMEIDDELITFLMNSTVRINKKRDNIIIKMKQQDNQITFVYNTRNVFDTELDSNFLTYNNYYKTKTLLEELIKDLDADKLKNHIEISIKYNDFILSFIQWKNYSIQDLELCRDLINGIHITTTYMEDYLITEDAQAINEFNLQVRESIKINNYFIYRLTMEEIEKVYA